MVPYDPGAIQKRMDQPRIPALDFAFFPMTGQEEGRLLGWEVTMLDIDLLKNAALGNSECHAQSMPLLIGEVTELLEGPILKLVAKRRLKLWLPISYTSLSDDEWINGLVEQFSGTDALRLGVALVLRWDDLPPAILGLRNNVRRLRRAGLRAVDTAHAPIALAFQEDFAAANTSGNHASADDLSRTLPEAIIEDVRFGAPVNFASMVRQLR